MIMLPLAPVHCGVPATVGRVAGSVIWGEERAEKGPWPTAVRAAMAMTYAVSALRWRTSSQGWAAVTFLVTRHACGLAPGWLREGKAVRVRAEIIPTASTLRGVGEYLC